MEISNNNNKYRGNILVVDDMPANLTLLVDMLQGADYRVRPVPSGKMAFKVVENEPPDLILLDIDMPEIDGFEVCRRLKHDVRFRDIPIIFISAFGETKDKVKAFNLGGVDYVTKPFQLSEVQARIETHLQLRRYQTHLEDIVEEQVKEISNLQLSTIFALSKLAELRDKTTGTHLERVQVFCKLIAEILCREGKFPEIIDIDFISNIFNASPLHDIGKVACSDSILLKPGPLTSEEFEIMKNHTIVGANTMEAVRSIYPKNAFINMGISIARSHHEHWDGTGYPDGLKGEAIPLSARIMAVADVYDALRSQRCYKRPFSHDKCCKIIMDSTGTQLDPILGKVFLQLEKNFLEIWQEMNDK